MIPTRAMLNRAMALALGWTEDDRYWHGPGGELRPRNGPNTVGLPPPWPKYTDDRNAPPEIWALLKRNHLWPKFGHLLREQLQQVTTVGALAFLEADPRLQVIAALQALGHWPDDWQSGPCNCCPRAGASRITTAYPFDCPKSCPCHE